VDKQGAPWHCPKWRIESVEHLLNTHAPLLTLQ